MSDAFGAPIYEFAGFRLHLRKRLLFSVDHQTVPLSPRAFETLVVLVEQAGEMLDKSELMRKVWPKTVVEENSLNQCISQLRRALGERPGEHRFIVTVPGRGYRFVAEVSRVSGNEALGADPSRTPAAAPAPAVREPALAAKYASHPPPTAARTSIAVLPLVNLTRDADKEYFGDGIAEELINMLTRVPGLKVPARTSSFAYKGRHIDVREIAKDLGVDALLEGSVRSAGDRVRLTVQLVDGQSGYHLWSQNYDRDFRDLFALQDELAGAIVQAIRGTLNGSVDTVTQGPPTQDLEAYQLYLRGRALMAQGTEENLRRAVELLRQAVARDPAFARAYGAMALAHWVAFFLNHPVPDPLGDAEREAERALALDPKLAEAHGVLGSVYSARLEWLKADASLRVAWTLDENDAFTRTQRAVNVGAALGHLRQAVEDIRAAHRLAPANALVAMRLAAVLQVSGSSTTEAVRYMSLAVDLGLPKTLTPIPLMFGFAALREQRYTEAADHLVQDLSVQAVAGEHAVRLALNALATGGETAQAIGALRAVELQADPRKLAWNGLGLICQLYTWLGALDHAYEAAHRTLDEMARSGPVWIFPGNFWVPEMRAFRQDPRFQALVTRLGLMRYWEEYGPPDNCELRDGRLICH